jgi:hypothetical protein
VPEVAEKTIFMANAKRQAGQKGLPQSNTVSSAKS